jgi:hypothetical protein
MTEKKTIVPFDVDSATYVGDENDGVYYQVARGDDGWYMTAVVNCDTASFVDDLVVDDGPYDSEADAIEGGKNAAFGWCFDNDVLLDDE